MTVIYVPVYYFHPNLTSANLLKLQNLQILITEIFFLYILQHFFLLRKALWNVKHDIIKQFVQIIGKMNEQKDGIPVG